MNDLVWVPRPGAVPRYGDAIHLLRGMGVSTTRLAGLFQTSEVNVRQVTSRLYDPPTEAKPPASINDLIDQYRNETYWSELRSKSGIRPAASTSSKRDELEASALREYARFKQTLEFAQGAAVLRLYLPYVGRASTAEVLRLKAVIHELIAWFYTHAGQSSSSVRHAEMSMQAAAAAFDESLGDRRYLVPYSESALIASNSLLNSHHYKAAIRFLDEADAANLARGEVLGSEHFRQRGVALFQQGLDDEAAKMFVKAKQAGRIEWTAPSDMDLEVASDRPLYLLKPNKGFESSLELLGRVEKHFGSGSLQHVMAANWSSATALRTGSNYCLKIALANLQATAASASRFGHEATVNFLLSITPALMLPSESQQRWIRFLLYENAFRTN